MRVNMDSSIVSDPRFKLVAKALDVKWTEVIGSCFLVWLACYDRRSTCLRKIEADLAADLDGFSDALIDWKLADDMGDDVVRIHGVEERIDFLIKQSKSGAKGGKAKAKNAKRDVPSKGNNPVVASAIAPATGSALANTLTPDQSLTPDHAPDQSLSDAPAERSPITRSMLEQVYAHYPKKTGKAKGLDKAFATVKTSEDFAEMERCVLAMAKAWRGRDTQFCPGFLPFVNGRRWEDEDWPLPTTPGDSRERPPDRAQELWDRSERMRRDEEAAGASDPESGTGGAT